MPPRFAANVSILFTERPFLERFDAAARAGFGTVEFWWPAGERLDDVTAAVRASALDVVLINFDGGDLAAGDRGLINDAAREQRFRDNVPVALEFGRSVGCSMFNAAGRDRARPRVARRPTRPRGGKRALGGAGGGSARRTGAHRGHQRVGQRPLSAVADA